MAESKTNPQQQTQTGTKEGGQGLARQERQRRGLQRWDPFAGSSFASPFQVMDRMTEEMDRMFDRVFGVQRRPSFARGLFGGPAREGLWAPRVETFQKGDQFVVRADLPGLNKDDVQVELTEDALSIHGERREEHEEEREGIYQSEREYGQFHRTIPLPEGVITESAKAAFKNGVLEVTMQAAPSEANRGRRLEIKEESESGGERK